MVQEFLNLDEFEESYAQYKVVWSLMMFKQFSNPRYRLPPLILSLFKVHRIKQNKDGIRF